jgi:hypothetical protein
VSGDDVVFSADPAGRIVAYIQTMAQLPAEPTWVLVGGLAVNARVRRVHRATNDIDTVSHDQFRLVEILSAGDADQLSAAKVQLHHPEVEVDVMESTEGAALPAEASDRAFALARRWAMATASPVRLRVVDGQDLISHATPQVASVPALVGLKCVSIPRRKNGSPAVSVGALSSGFAAQGPGLPGIWPLRSIARRGRQGAPQARPDTGGRPTLDEPGGSPCASHD